MNETFKIELKIDNSPYPMTIDRKEEEFYRAAAKQIDNKLNKYRTVFPDASPAQHWAMAALDISYENIRMKDRNDTGPFTQKLGELTKELEQYL
jgi:cell division protein ZapA